MLKNLRGVIHCRLARNARHKASLLGRAKDHHPAAQIKTQPGEFGQIIGRFAPHFGVGACQVQALGLGQQPVQADYFQSGTFGQAANFRPLPRGNFICLLRQCKRCDLHARVTAIGGEIKGLFQRPILERLVADGKFHMNFFPLPSLEKGCRGEGRSSDRLIFA